MPLLSTSRSSLATKLTVLVSALLLAACERGTCIFLSGPTYVVPRIQQGQAVPFPFGVIAKSEHAFGGGEILPAIVDFRLLGENPDLIRISPNPVEVGPHQRTSVTFAASRDTPPAVYTVEGACLPRGLRGDRTVARFMVEVDAALFFSLVPTPASLRVDRGSIQSTAIDIRRDPGFIDPVSLAVDGVPPGAAVGMNSGPTTGTSVGLSFSAGTAAPGRYTLTIRGTAAGLVRTAAMRVEIVGEEEPLDFAIAANPASLTVVPGSTAQIAITITRINFTPAVSFYVDLLPPTFPSIFSPQSTFGSSSVLTIQVPPTAPLGLMRIVVGAIANDSPRPIDAREVVVNLTIAPPPSPPSLPES